LSKDIVRSVCQALGTDSYCKAEHDERRRNRVDA
jgi:hypothetical protein